MIPEPGRQAVLAELHEGHPGICKMKSLARMYVWWPGLDAEIEKSVRLCQACQACQANQSLPPQVPFNPWKWPSKPWSRLHLDFAGPLRMRCFWCWWMPIQGGHVTSAPYHPASNGLAERAVQIIKRGLRKVTGGDIYTRLAKVLLNYRISPQGTTGVAPTELLLGRKLRSRLDLLLPDLTQRVERMQDIQKRGSDVHTKQRNFEVGSRVFVRNFGQGDKWLQSTIVQSRPPMYMVKLNDG